MIFIYIGIGLIVLGAVLYIKWFLFEAADD